MLKLTIFRIVKRKERCAVICYLKLFFEQAGLLGFSKSLLSPKTVWYWEKICIKTTGFLNLFNETVWHIKSLLQAIGIVLARILGLNSTLLIACRNDEDEFAVFNPYYKKYMYKTDTACCGETGIPVDYGISGGLTFDGHKLLDVVERITVFNFLLTKKDSD